MAGIAPRWTHDLIELVFGLLAMRFNLSVVPNVFLVEAATLLPLVIICHLGTSVVLGVPRGAWRFTSLYDLTKVTQAVVFGTAIVAALVFTYDRMWAVPRSVFLLQTLLLIGFLAGPRILYRTWHDRETRQDIDVGYREGTNRWRGHRGGNVDP